MTLIFSLQLQLTGGLPRLPSERDRLLAARSFTLGLECPMMGGDRKMLDQYMNFKWTRPKYLLSPLWKRLTHEPGRRGRSPSRMARIVCSMVPRP